MFVDLSLATNREFIGTSLVTAMGKEVTHDGIGSFRQ